MKVMLRCDQTRPYLDKADEIYVPFKRMDLVEEIHTQYPKKSILLDLTEVPREDIEENDIMLLSGYCKGQLKVLVNYDYFENNDIVNRVLAYPMRSFFEMRVAMSHGINEFYIGPELIHQLDKLKRFKENNPEVVIRVCGNLSAYGYEESMGFELRQFGGYILPQELTLDIVSEVIDYIDFKSISATQEGAYYNIYLEEHYWGGEIKDLIKDYDSNSLIRMMEPRDIRFRCNMGCMSNNNCHYCEHNIAFANPSLYKNLEKPEDLDNG